MPVEEPKQAQTPPPTTPQPSASPQPPATPQASAPTQPPASTQPPEKPTTSPPSKFSSLISGNKGLIIAIIVVVLAAIIGFIALTNFGTTKEYQGLIEKVEQQTEDLEGGNQ
jgi:cell division protein FtsL